MQSVSYLEANEAPAADKGKTNPERPGERVLTDAEKQIATRRRGDVVRLQQALLAAAAIWEETHTLLTGGDAALAVDLQRGMIVRKDG